MLDESFAAAALVADRLGGPADVPVTSGGRHPQAGLMRGSCGPALLFLHLYEYTGNTLWLGLVETALRQDLRRCVILDKDGSMHVNEGRRSLPYLAHGSAGIGLVLRRYLRHQPNEEFEAAAAAIRTACTSRFYAQSGLFAGRAGTILGLADGGTDPGLDPETAEQVQGLAWHAVSHDGTLAFPGDQLYRLSSDLATGAAGVLLALGAVLHSSPVYLPFLAPDPSSRPPKPVLVDAGTVPTTTGPGAAADAPRGPVIPRPQSGGAPAEAGSRPPQTAPPVSHG